MNETKIMIYLEKAEEKRTTMENNLRNAMSFIEVLDGTSNEDDVIKHYISKKTKSELMAAKDNLKLFYQNYGMFLDLLIEEVEASVKES